MLDMQRKLLHWGAQLVIIKKLEKSVNVSTKFQFKSPARSKERGGMLIRLDKLWIEDLDPITTQRAVLVMHTCFC